MSLLIPANSTTLLTRSQVDLPFVALASDTRSVLE